MVYTFYYLILFYRMYKQINESFFVDNIKYDFSIPKAGIGVRNKFNCFIGLIFRHFFLIINSYVVFQSTVFDSLNF